MKKKRARVFRWRQKSRLLAVYLHWPRLWLLSVYNCYVLLTVTAFCSFQCCFSAFTLSAINIHMFILYFVSFFLHFYFFFGCTFFGKTSEIRYAPLDVCPFCWLVAAAIVVVVVVVLVFSFQHLSPLAFVSKEHSERGGQAWLGTQRAVLPFSHFPRQI